LALAGEPRGHVDAFLAALEQVAADGAVPGPVRALPGAAAALAAAAAGGRRPTSAPAGSAADHEAGPRWWRGPGKRPGRRTGRISPVLPPSWSEIRRWTWRPRSPPGPAWWPSRPAATPAASWPP